MPGSRKGNWPKVAIGGLVLLNLVLLAALALRDPSATLAAVPAAPASSTIGSPRPGPERTATPKAQVSTPTASPETSESPKASSTPGSEESPTDLVRSTRLLAVNSDELAWRATFGPCPTDPDIEVSRDGGETWRRTDVDLRSVTRLRSYNESAVFAVGGAEGCKARYVATGGPEESWAPNEEMLTQTWYRLPSQPDRVHAPSGRMSSPCQQQRLGDFAGLGDSNAGAVCEDGTVRLTSDSGRTWQDLKGVEAGLALGADDGVYALAVRKAGCDGVAVTVLDPDTEKVNEDQVRCAPVGRDPDEVAVGVRGRVVWLWTDDEVAISTDRARTWERT